MERVGIVSPESELNRPAAAPRVTHVRWYVVAALFSLSMLTIVDRVCISAAKLDMARDLGLSDVTFGFIFGAFALGYALFQIPSGWLADRYGPRFYLTAIVLAWSLFTGLTGVVSAAAALIVIRFLFGVGEAGAYPAAARAIYKWLPAKETGIAQGVMFAGSRLGAAFGLAVMSWTILKIGWRSSYLLLTAIGVAWALFWYLFFRDDPGQKGGVSESEREYIRSGRQRTRQVPGTSAPWTRLLLSRESGILLAQYFASNFTFFLCFSWLLPYLKQQYSLTAAEAGVYSSVPLYFGALANWVSGLCVDRLFKKGFGHHSRIIPAAAGFLVAALALVAAANMTNAAGAVLCFAIATFGVDLTLSPSWTACIDIAGRHTGALSGAMNMIGNLGSFASSVTFPMLVDFSGSAKSYFYLAALLDALAVVLWWRLRQTDFTRKEK